jgi:hypothetical protein
MILNKMSELLATYPNCVPLKCPTDEEKPITVCGDVHGQVRVLFETTHTHIYTYI